MPASGLAAMKREHASGLDPQEIVCRRPPLPLRKGDSIHGGRSSSRPCLPHSTSLRQWTVCRLRAMCSGSAASASSSIRDPGRQSQGSFVTQPPPVLEEAPRASAPPGLLAAVPWTPARTTSPDYISPCCPDSPASIRPTAPLAETR